MNKNIWGAFVGVAVGFVAIVAAVDLTVEKVSAIQTDAEAKTWRDKHELTEAEKFKNDRIDRAEREVYRLEYDLLSPNLTPEQVKSKERQLQKWDKKIECIQADKC